MHQYTAYQLGLEDTYSLRRAAGSPISERLGGEQATDAGQFTLTQRRSESACRSGYLLR